MNSYDGESISCDGTGSRNSERRGHYSALRQSHEAVRIENLDRVRNNLPGEEPVKTRSGNVNLNRFMRMLRKNLERYRQIYKTYEDLNL